MSQDVYIVGVAETGLGEVHDQTEQSMLMLAAKEALGEGGLALADVDGILVNYMGEEGSVQVGEYMGIFAPRYTDSSDLGGAAFEAFVHHAMLAIQAGRCDVALIGYSSRQRTLRSRSMAWKRPEMSLGSQFEDPYGMPIPIGQYALATARHMHQYGTTREHLAEVAVSARRWAQLNPKAWKRDPLTHDDVIGSRLIADPLRKLDCCLITDGGGVVILANEARARDAVKTPIKVLGAGESHRHWHIAQAPDLAETAAVVSGREAFGMAGVGPSDVDVVQIYDSFTITPILGLEDLGFCPKGEGGPFMEGGRTAPGGELPVNTSGGGLSYCHPGAFGILLLIEAVRQLRGEAGERQVADARIAVAHGYGGFLSTASTVVLASE